MQTRHRTKPSNLRRREWNIPFVGSSFQVEVFLTICGKVRIGFSLMRNRFFNQSSSQHPPSAVRSAGSVLATMNRLDPVQWSAPQSPRGPRERWYQCSNISNKSCLILLNSGIQAISKHGPQRSTVRFDNFRKPFRSGGWTQTIVIDGVDVSSSVC